MPIRLLVLLVSSQVWIHGVCAELSPVPIGSTRTFVFPKGIHGSFRIVPCLRKQDFEEYPWKGISSSSQYTICESCVVYLQPDVQEAKLLKTIADNVFFLSLRFQKISDTDLAYVRHLSSLRMLDLAFTEITDDAIEVVNCFKKLESLEVTGTDVSDQFVVSLDPELPLCRIQMSSTRITDAGLRDLCSKYRNLKLLSVPSTITDDGFRNLSRLQQMRRLFCSGCNVTDHCVSEVLESLRKMEVLAIDGTKVTWRILNSLALLPNLRMVKLPASIPMSHIVDFRRSHPEITVVRSDE